ncbi:MAG: crossover junction endodeoxyribonuclease RuvC [Planctomycetes bacterium]|nr:crossover junction endodeoxyribonuclease RuvC [Planctomycetota bacterium]
MSRMRARSIPSPTVVKSPRAASVRILGVDPGTLVVGFGVIDDDGTRMQARDYGAIRAPRGDAVADRLLAIHQALGMLIKKHRPDVVALERVFFGRSAAAALRIGEARGVVLVTARIAGVPVSEYAPAVVKKSVAGGGLASKEQVQEMVRRILSLRETPEPADAADALELCICHSNRSRWERLYPF